MRKALQLIALDDAIHVGVSICLSIVVCFHDDVLRCNRNSADHNLAIEETRLNHMACAGSCLTNVFPSIRMNTKFFAAELKLAILHRLDLAFEPFTRLELNPAKVIFWR